MPLNQNQKVKQNWLYLACQRRRACWPSAFERASPVSGPVRRPILGPPVGTIKPSGKVIKSWLMFETLSAPVLVSIVSGHWTEQVPRCGINGVRLCSAFLLN